MNVLEASKKRIETIFDEFENIYLSFSGGKDSGVLFHLMAEEAAKRKRKFTVLIIDIEANYQLTVDYMKNMLKKYKEVITPIWVCLPMTTDNSLSYYEMTWTWWEKEKEPIWVRKMPKMKYVVNLENHTFDFYNENITFEKFVKEFADWFSKGEKTACIIGIRTQESLNRWRAINRDDKSMYKKLNYSTQSTESTYNFYPIYDWKVEDIWTYYGKTGLEYNKFYDLMYKAGISINKMRIDEPFGDTAKAGLNMFKVIEPNTWAKVVNRVSGANFGNIYGRTNIMSSKYKLPKNHTWKSFLEFLLNTLPKEAAEHYQSKFDVFIKHWITVGSPMPDSSIKILEENYNKYIENTHSYSRRGKGDKIVIKFTDIVDEIPELDSKDDVLTYKRMAMAIIKNDYYCTSLSFSLTKQQINKRNELIKKYKEIL